MMFSRSLLPWIMLAATVGGVLGGAVAGWVSASIALNARQGAPASTTTTRAEPNQPVPLEHRPLISSYPSFSNRLSSVLPIVKKGVDDPLPEDRLIPADRLVGYAVAVTSDGWLVAPSAVFQGSRVADLAVIWDGAALPVQRAYRDQATDLVYAKIAASRLPVVAFLHPTEVVAGSAAWVEASSHRFFPDLILDTRTELFLTAPVSSERAVRRFLVSHAGSEAPGGAVWDQQGRLIGLMEARAGSGWRVVPVGTVGSAISALLEHGVIRRSSLGVRSLPLPSAQFDAGRASLPPQGAWLLPDRRTGAPAVVASGPASRQLKEGDVIERMERDVFDGGADLGEKLLDYRPGTSVRLLGTRGGQPLDVVVTLGSVTSSEVLK